MAMAVLVAGVWPVLGRIGNHFKIRMILDVIAKDGAVSRAEMGHAQTLTAGNRSWSRGGWARTTSLR